MRVGEEQRTIGSVAAKQTPPGEGRSLIHCSQVVQDAHCEVALQEGVFEQSWPLPRKDQDCNTPVLTDATNEVVCPLRETGRLVAGKDDQSVLEDSLALQPTDELAYCLVQIGHGPVQTTLAGQFVQIRDGVWVMRSDSEQGEEPGPAGRLETTNLIEAEAPERPGRRYPTCF